MELVDILFGFIMMTGFWLAYLCGKDVNCLKCKDGGTKCDKN